MRIALLTAALLLAGVWLPEEGQAQTSAGTVMVGATIAEPVSAAVDGAVRVRRGEVSAPVRVRGQAAPLVSVSQGERSTSCAAEKAGEAEAADGARVHCVFPPAQAAGGGEAPTVTIVISGNV